MFFSFKNLVQVARETLAGESRQSPLKKDANIVVVDVVVNGPDNYFNVVTICIMISYKLILKDKFLD